MKKSFAMISLAVGGLLSYTQAYGVMYLARPYDPNMARWLTRDPFGERGGENLYCFVGNNAIGNVDYFGQWSSDVHKDKTIVWASALYFAEDAAKAIGEADNAVDGLSGGKSWAPWIGDQSYHFNRNPGGGTDSRMQHNAQHEQNAVYACTIAAGNDDPKKAAEELGTALHPLQDWVAHGDFSIKWGGPITAVHNAYSLQKDIPYGVPAFRAPDDTRLDAVGPDGTMDPDGRAAGAVMQYYNLPQPTGRPIDGPPTGSGMLVDWAQFKVGGLRLAKTEQLTTQHLRSFREYVKLFGGCGC